MLSFKHIDHQKKELNVASLTAQTQSRSTSVSVLIYLRKLVRIVLFIIATMLDLLSASLKWTSKNIEAIALVISRIIMVAVVIYSATMFVGFGIQILQSINARTLLPDNLTFAFFKANFHVSILAIIASFFFIDRMSRWPIKTWLKKILSGLLSALN